jgi:hypothetical protein
VLREAPVETSEKKCENDKYDRMWEAATSEAAAGKKPKQTTENKNAMAGTEKSARDTNQTGRKEPVETSKETTGDDRMWEAATRRRRTRTPYKQREENER